MPNPSGANGLFDATGSDTAYGARRRIEQTTKAAPMAGGPATASVLDTPRRSKKRAGRAAAPQPMATPTPQPAEITPAASVAQVWQQLAQVPGASPLVLEYAQRAAQLG